MSFLAYSQSPNPVLNNSTAFTIDRQIFTSVLRSAMYSIGFCERSYLLRYEDVRNAVEMGHLKSALDHFVNYGYFEGRIAVDIVVDNDFYIEHNPDVRDHIERGLMPSAQFHFERYGRTEGRLPFAGFQTNDQNLEFVVEQEPEAIEEPSPAEDRWDIEASLVPIHAPEKKPKRKSLALDRFAGALKQMTEHTVPHRRTLRACEA